MTFLFSPQVAGKHPLIIISIRIINLINNPVSIERSLVTDISLGSNLRPRIVPHLPIRGKTRQATVPASQ